MRTRAKNLREMFPSPGIVERGERLVNVSAILNIWLPKFPTITKSKPENEAEERSQGKIS